MARTWHYEKSDGTIATASGEELYQLAEVGEIDYFTYLWHDGMEEWATAGQLANRNARTKDALPVQLHTVPTLDQRCTWWQILFSLNGRISRSTFWLNLVFAFVCTSAVSALVTNLFPDSFNQDSGEMGTLALILSMFIVSAFLWVFIALSVKRYHDCNKSGAWVFINLIPYIGWIWTLVANGFLRGTNGHNGYGPDPKDRKRRPQPQPTAKIAQQAPTPAAAPKSVSDRLHEWFEKSYYEDVTQDFARLGEATGMVALTSLMTEVTHSLIKLQKDTKKAQNSGHATIPARTVAEQTSFAAKRLFEIADQIEKAKILDRDNALVTAKIEEWQNARIVTVQKLNTALTKAHEQFGVAVANAVFESDSEKSRADEMECFVREMSELGCIVDELAAIDKVV